MVMKGDLNRPGVIIVAFALLFLTPNYSLAQDYPGAIWDAAHSSNYDNVSRPDSQIEWIIIHTTEITCNFTRLLFKDSSSNVSAHYLICLDGTIYQMVRDEDIAWTAGNYGYNSASINIEYERYGSNNWTEAQYQASVSLVNWLSDNYAVTRTFYNPPNETAPCSAGAGNGIIGHKQVPNPTNCNLQGGISGHTDPVNWNWPYYMQLITQALKPDLYLYSLIGPTGIIAGQPATLSAGIGNQEAVSSDSFILRFYLSTNSTISNSDTPLASCNYPSGLGANQSTSCNKTISFPTSVAPGTYHLGAYIDYQDTVDETDEGNNTRVADSGTLLVPGC